MAQSWLGRQRKQTLLDLSKEAGLKQDEDLKKDELVEHLHSHLQANATRLSRNSAFESYYGPRSSTPFKSTENLVEKVTEDVKSVVKGRGRKSTKSKGETSDSDATSPNRALAKASSSVSALVPSSKSISQSFSKRTPSLNRVRQSIPGPPSPSAIADAVERASNKYLGGLSDLYSVSGVDEYVTSLRTLCSSVTSVQLSFLLLEAFAVQREVVPLRYAFETPAVPAVGLKSLVVKLPDFFALLTPRYWSTTWLWIATSIVVPAIFAYFFNLTVKETRRHGAKSSLPKQTTDPLTFNVAKGLVTYLVYGRGFGSSFINQETAGRVDDAIYGGYGGILVGAGVGALAALYEAAQGR